MSEQFSYTAQDLEDAQKRPQLPPEQWLQFIIESEKFDIAEKSGNFTIKTKCVPFEKPNDPKSLKKGLATFNNITLPLQNKERAGHKASNMAGLFKTFLRAIEWADAKGAQCPSSATRDPDTQDLMLDGKVCTPEEAKAREAAVTAWVMDQAVDIATRLKAVSEGKSKEKVLKGYLFYAQTVQNGDYLNLTNLQPKLPKDAKYGSVRAAGAQPTKGETE